jgi:hypothetical protein
MERKLTEQEKMLLGESYDPEGKELIDEQAQRTHNDRG